MADITTDVLDHIVHLVPPGTLDQASNVFRNIGFNVLPGGVHARGLTTNAIIVFADGVYLEIIAFNYPVTHYPPDSPERRMRENNPWANKAPGWIDYAFLGNGSLEKRISTLVNDRMEREGSTFQYLTEVVGGRTRTDGVNLQWLITAPDDDESRGLLPFFCGDITPRTMRVPEEYPNTRHSSGAIGIAFIRIISDVSWLQTLARQLATVVGREPQKSSDTSHTWHLRSPKAKTVELIVSVPRDETEMQFVKGSKARMYEIGIYTTTESDGGTMETPYGKVSWLPSTKST